MNKSDRYTWSAMGAKYPTLNVVDWHHPDGPKVIAAVPQSDDGEQLAAEAVIRLMSLAPTQGEAP